MIEYAFELSRIGVEITVPPLTGSKISKHLQNDMRVNFCLPFLVLMIMEDSDEKPSSL